MIPFLPYLKWNHIDSKTQILNLFFNHQLDWGCTCDNTRKGSQHGHGFCFRRKFSAPTPKGIIIRLEPGCQPGTLILNTKITFFQLSGKSLGRYNAFIKKTHPSVEKLHLENATLVLEFMKVGASLFLLCFNYAQPEDDNKIGK